jgi:oxepin-CoA hydrolase/3-oxo-5,6-dehydrosuberyl-CoA semialdehyde dehydrogenase
LGNDDAAAYGRTHGRTIPLCNGAKGEFDIATPEEHLPKYRETVFNHRPFPREHKHPLMKNGENEALQYPDLETAKQKLLEAYDAYEAVFQGES